MSSARDASPDFVLMRLVSATEYEEDPVGSGLGKTGHLHHHLQHHHHHHHHHHLQHLPHLQHGLGMAGGSERERDGRSEAAGQLMVLQDLLGPGDPSLDGPGPRTGPGSGAAVELSSSVEAPARRFDWNPVFRLTKMSKEVSETLCQRHRLISDAPEWSPLADHVGATTYKPSNTATVTPDLQDPVLNLARRLGELGKGDVLQKDGDVPLCTCRNVPGAQPGEDPSETSDALLVLEGLGAQGVETGEVGKAGCRDGSESNSMDRSVPQLGQEQPQTFSSSSLSGLMNQVHRLTQEACRDPSSLAEPEGTGIHRSPPAQDAAAPVQAPLSRPPTPKHVGSPLTFAACSREQDRAAQRKSRKGSLKVCLSKLFRTKSSGSAGSSSSVGHAADKRPSLASSTSSGGSLVDVWGSSSTDPDTGSCSRPQLARPRSAYSPVPFTDDFGGPQPGRLLSNGGTASTQMLTQAHPTIQHSLSLNDTFLRSMPRPLPLQPDSQSAAAVEQRPLVFPLSRPDSNSFATSLRELEKCGWYWGPMNWEDAEMKLKEKADGSFLVRDSSDPRYILSLSFRSQGVTHHTRMEHYRDSDWYCHWHEDFGSVTDMKTLVGSATGMKTLIGSATDMKTLVGSVTDMKTLIGSVADMKTLIGSAADMKTLIGSATGMKTLIGSATDMKTLIGSAVDMKTLVGSATGMKTLIGSAVDMKTLVVSAADMKTLIGSAADMKTLISSAMRIPVLLLIWRLCCSAVWTFSLWCHPKFEDRCHSVVEFIERAIMHSKNGRFLYFLRSRVPGLPPTPVQLLYPVSRFSSVKSLQHLCRFCIRQLVRIDHIQELPLPTPLIVYLRKFYFYDPEEEKYMSFRGSGAGVLQTDGDSHHIPGKQEDSDNVSP
ncbi:hypothetical protein NFI96_019416, partial [Prochilodus magdalenae]